MVAHRYILLNAAVAVECYEPSKFDDSTTADNDMLHPLEQEIFKGRPLTPGNTGWAGWGKNPAYADADAANAAPDGDLQTEPVFRKDPSGSSSEPDIFDSGLNQDEINELLAKGIPALSPPMGRGIDDWNDDDANVDMETLKQDGEEIPKISPMVTGGSMATGRTWPTFTPTNCLNSLSKKEI